ncbi:MAG: NADPH:quinone reductase [Candidatus Marinimicrobia bacterium]|jgi:NADPH2:quinone reductase|nr:NADPH:quinone reductase [Candidatus Neomarinimicrobiota bacterium]|tara:strand:+ start:265 stop:1248 length:984 start_codon:yes stop_codon:yes gene_type:complete
MKAVWYEEFGAAEDVLQFGDFKTPEPKAGQVKIRVHASGVNPSDTKKRLGANPKLLAAGPVIPNSDGAGEIVEVGDNVSADRVGERVWIYNGQFGQQEGTSAEFICVPEHQAVFLPENVSYEEGAMMGIPAMTAHRCVTADGSVKGKTILVTGGAGRVSYYAIQWAKHFGATVIATGSSEESKTHCNKAGADLVLGHPSTETTKEILDFTNGKKIDRVVEGDFGVNLNPVLDVLKTNGIIATYSSMTDMNPAIPFIQMMFMDLTIRMVLVYVMPMDAKQQAIADITSMLKDGKLDNRVAETYALDDSANAHNSIEKGGNFGSVIIKI